MINVDTPYNYSYEDAIISVITTDKQLEFIELLAAQNIKTHLMDTIPNNIESWGVSPDTIILDSMTNVEWEKQVDVLRQINTYKDIPVIVLSKEEVQIEDIFSTYNKEYLYVHRENPKSVIRATLATIAYWKKLNNALVKTNQLNRILSTNYLVLDAKNECLEKVQLQINQVSDLVTSDIKKEFIKINDIITDNLKKGDHYQLFKAHFEEVHPLFYKKLLVMNKDLSNNDLKLAAFLKMNFNNTEISFFMGISIAGVKKAIQRLRKKLGLQPKESLRQFIFTIEV
ncbi:helix-turn-helix transcriptional regulator [Aquimarina sp. 2304DJ70-9]|uniref:helix-turn-helix transcriptional regulator n=1 Tax=Aquimarina penaris TaxID=3231044 RepID=UPI003462C845